MRTLTPLAVLLLLAASNPGLADDVQPLIDFAEAGEAQFEPTSDQVAYAIRDGGLDVTIGPGGESYPGLFIRPAGQVWDLSRFGRIEAQVTNTGDKAFSLSLRVDNPGDWRKKPWNTESIRLKPGESRTLKVIFGYQHGQKPGFKLDPSKINKLLVFTTKTKHARSFRIDSIQAAGPVGEKPGLKPHQVRTKPMDGYLFGGPVKIDAAKQVTAKNGAAAEMIDHAGRQALQVSLPANKAAHEVVLRPAVGRWDLRNASEVKLKVTNTGDTPVTPGVRVMSDKRHATRTAFVDAPIPPGETGEVVALFEAAEPWRGQTGTVTKLHAPGQKGTGTKFASDKADTVVVVVKHEGDASVRIDAIMATADPIQTPEWLGQRPPVEGDWTLTFQDEFDGENIDLNRWNIYTENYWDKRSHFTKDNVILGDGMVRLLMEKKTGYENDNPQRKMTDYAVGFLDTYGKWVQRYGYFEARMKLATAPGLWPAFWMMPDRGEEVGPQWVRADTGKGGMEFDIMEHLTRWGPYRYNVAMHWDGYGKRHKSTGSTNIYIQHDEDGFITAGLLWTPGSLIYYCNGKEVARWENDRVSHVEAYPIFYLMTGGWDNSRLDDTQLPDEFVIDYIRVWQRADLASEVDGYQGAAAEAAAAQP